jgi:MFS family permease
VATIAEGGTPAATKPAAVPKAAYYALFVLTCANLLNYLDRQIVSILAQAMKADLKLDDADLGFLLGTAFAVFYSVVGIAMGRISDGLPRKKVMALGLVLWSGMTALGGAATSFASLGLARIGVGVGEAVATPCAQSILADVFPQRNRAIAMSIYLSGTFLGGAVAMIVGGYFLQNWQGQNSLGMCGAVPIAGACGLAGWKAALIAVGLPGLPLALALLAIREPKRETETKGSAGRFVLGEFASALPPFTLLTIHRVGGMRGLTNNLLLAAILSAAAWGIAHLTGDAAQWWSFGLGAYAVVTWGQIQSYRDKPLFAVTFGDPTFLLGTVATAFIACIGGAVHVWSAPYAMRTYDIPAHEIGASLGLVHVAGAVIGVLAGGWAVDRWKQHDARAPLGMAAICLVLALPMITMMLLVHDYTAFLAGTFALGLLTAAFSGGLAALIQDLVLPRMRGAAAAAFSLVAIVIASGTGPYWAGKVSAVTGSLTAGLLSMMALAPISLVLLWLAARRLKHETPERRRALAEAAGEPPLA